jgi:hypothetical protein
MFFLLQYFQQQELTFLSSRIIKVMHDRSSHKAIFRNNLTLAVTAGITFTAALFVHQRSLTTIRA